MPNYKGHLIGGACVSMATLLIMVMGFKYKPTGMLCIEWFLCTLFGALFPDIDTKSKGQRITYIMWFLTALWFFLQRKFYACALWSMVAFVPLMGNHRGMTHRIPFYGMVNGLVMVLVTIYMPQSTQWIIYDLMFFDMGVLSHLILDRGLARTFSL